MLLHHRERRWQLALLPPWCCLCGLPADGDRDLCTTCEADLVPPLHPCSRCGEPLAPGAAAWPCGRCQRHPPPWDALVARCLWAPTAAMLVHRLKFSRETECARVMAELMVARPPDFLCPEAALVPVPLHWRRRWRRGFDQAALLAAQLARITGLRSTDRGLRRRRSTVAQSSQPARHRRRALRGAFRARPGSLPRVVVLVDDVTTTGATLAAAATACRAAGAERVLAWLFARTPRPEGRPAPT